MFFYACTPLNNDEATNFDGTRALEDVNYQISLGPRIPGTNAHSQFIDWSIAELSSNDWNVEIQEIEQNEKPIKNVIAKRGQGKPWTILAAHFDTRIVSDRDPEPANWNVPVPGANDGASGIAVLLELARIFPKEIDGQIWLVLFDMEDNGNIPGYDWIMGSTAFVNSLQSTPDQAIIVDMVGDSDLQIYYERNSNQDLMVEIWDQAKLLGYEQQFIQSFRHSMIDDHTPFVQAGIPAVDIIDFDYPYHHTVQDTVDKVSAESLNAVGDTLTAWLMLKHGMQN